MSLWLGLRLRAHSQPKPAFICKKISSQRALRKNKIELTRDYLLLTLFLIDRYAMRCVALNATICDLEIRKMQRARNAKRNEEGAAQNAIVALCKTTFATSNCLILAAVLGGRKVRRQGARLGAIPAQILCEKSSFSVKPVTQGILVSS
jgi:hypothetical protein